MKSRSVFALTVCLLGLGLGVMGVSVSHLRGGETMLLPPRSLNANKEEWTSLLQIVSKTGSSHNPKEFESATKLLGQIEQRIHNAVEQIKEEYFNRVDAQKEGFANGVAKAEEKRQHANARFAETRRASDKRTEAPVEAAQRALERTQEEVGSVQQRVEKAIFKAQKQDSVLASAREELADEQALVKEKQSQMKQTKQDEKDLMEKTKDDLSSAHNDAMTEYNNSVSTAKKDLEDALNANKQAETVALSGFREQMEVLAKVRSMMEELMSHDGNKVVRADDDKIPDAATPEDEAESVDPQKENKNAVLLEMASQLATQVGVKWQASTYDSISQLLDVVYSRIDRNIKDVKAAMNKKAGQYREEFEGIMHKVTSEKDDTIARAEKVAKDASEESKARIANAEAAVEAAERLLLPRREAVAKAEASSKEAQNGLQLAKAALQAREDDVASARAALQRAKDTAAQGRQRNRQEEERAQAGAKKAKKQAIKIASEMAQAAMKAQRDAVNGKMSALMSELYLVKRIRMLIDNGEDPGPASAAQQQEWESWAKLPEEMTGSSGSTGASGATGAMNMDTASGATGFSGTGSENDEIEKLEKAMA